MWPGMIQAIPLTRMTDRTVTDRPAFRKVLEDVRDRGWSLVDQELEIGLIALAVPLRDSAGGLLGAINVGVPVLRMTADEMIALVLPKLQETVENISRAIKR
jgi:IclR family pca regulon transcriptional regulator